MSHQQVTSKAMTFPKPCLLLL